MFHHSVSEPLSSKGPQLRECTDHLKTPLKALIDSLSEIAQEGIVTIVLGGEIDLAEAAVEEARCPYCKCW